MLIPKKIIDNSDVTMASFLNEVLKEQPKGNLDIATAFFNINGYAMVKNNIKGVKRFRLLLGKAPEICSDDTLGKELLRIIREEIENYELDKDNESLVQDFIGFIKKASVEVKIYDKAFLHGKTYIFDSLVVIGSSNFTAAGLTHNTELNAVSLEGDAEYTRKHWFDKFWAEARDFKNELINILESSRFGSTEYSPYQVFIKSLYELQKEDIDEITKGEKRDGDLATSKVNLAEFQDDAVKRVFSRLKKYRSVLVADSVGLGKTWIAKKIIEEFGFYRRSKFLVVCPAQLRGMWKEEIKGLILAESILSQEELASEDFIQKAERASGKNLKDIKLIVVDESHNFRNPLSNRWENLFTLIHEHITSETNRPFIVFLTATPINNTLWDLYWQMMLLAMTDQSIFIKAGIPDLFKFFKEVNRKGDPSLLSELLNEISIRRTRDYIQKNYPDAEINGKIIKFPKRRLENINYKLDDTYQGLYKHISKVIETKLTMAYYKILEYKNAEKLTIPEQMLLGRMIALAGIFRTLLLKRLESSVEAFRKSVSKHLNFLKRFRDNLKNGKLLTKETFNKYVVNIGEEMDEEFKEELIDFNAADYRMNDIISDTDIDIDLFNGLLEKVSQITAQQDAKLKVLKEKLKKFADKEQVVLFTYFADTLDYIYGDISKDPEFAKLKIEAVSGRTSASERENLVRRYRDGKIDVLMSTDVLSEGMNLQSAQYLINYDLHWNPTRMIQRAGRIDRIGSPFPEIFVYNFSPEEELEELLKLVGKLQAKIRDIDESVGLDQTILGETVHPKVFGIIRRIKEGDVSVFDELEREAFGGGEKFYQPLREFLNKTSREIIEKIPYGIHSGLKKNTIKGIFFYYKYDRDFHFWYFYNVGSKEIIKDKARIIDFIECPPEDARIIPDFFNSVYEINKQIVEDIEHTYKEVEQKENVDPATVHMALDKSKKFINDIIREVDISLDENLFDSPEDKEFGQRWESIKEKLLNIPLTKRRLQDLRRIWKSYKKQHKKWQKLVNEISAFLQEKSVYDKEGIEPFDKAKLKLVAIDFIS